MTYQIVAIGEVLWDLLPTGKKVGGAPGNFAYHARQLGADAQMISRVGNDDLGHELLDFYRSRGLPVDFIAMDEKYPTGAVDVVVDSNGQPHYTFRDDVAWDHLVADEKSLTLCRNADAICYGTLAGRGTASREPLRQMILAAPKNAIRIFDVNLRAPHYKQENVLELLELANILKLNNDEIRVIARMLGNDATDVHDLAAWLRQKYDYKLLILTCGENGGILMTEKETSVYRSDPVNVVDTVGAGDAFTAAALIGYLNGEPLETINKTAADLAAYVCTQQGGMPDYP